ncbi:MAG TPA: lytic transglycosylase domain-containing protein [Mesorhizobium sp.]
MPALKTLSSMGLIVAAAGLCGCTTASNTAKPQLAETAGLAGQDAGFALPLPETVSILPESAFARAASNADLAALPPPLQPGEQLAAAQAGAQASPVVLASATPGFEPVGYAAPSSPAEANTGAVDQLIAKYAAVYELPEAFVRRVVKRESTFNPRAYNHGHWGLMQIKHATARGMGYLGPASGLFDAETNLKYAVKYLRGAWLVADRDENRADWLYQTGYYYDAKRKGMLGETGLGVDRRRSRRAPGVAATLPVAGQIGVPQTPVTAPVPAFSSTLPDA